MYMYTFLFSDAFKVELYRVCSLFILNKHFLNICISVSNYLLIGCLQLRLPSTLAYISN